MSDSRLLFKDKGKIEPKEIPSCLIPHQLVVCAWQLEIFSNKPMTILREAMTRYSHPGKPVEGNQSEIGRGKAQLQYNKSNRHKMIQRYGFYRRTVSIAS